MDLRRFRRQLLHWYDRHRRDLPWRIKPGTGRDLDPYHVLVSETMLQQTQVATVIPYFHRFLERFPSLAHLAAAPEQDVLRLWQGLGYYSRARNLQAAAREIVSRHDGILPARTEQLLELPGIGRYTAGAIASIAFGRREPIVDGNVQRVLCRLDRIEGDPRDREIQKQLWVRAEELLPARRTGDFNSALMELGATVCTPRNPQCLICPVREHCRAAAAGVQDRIPPPRKAAPLPLLRRNTYCIQRGDSWLLEQRPAKGRWAGMWQFPTFDAAFTAALPLNTTRPRRLATITHALTHRRYEFHVFQCEARNPEPFKAKEERTWARFEQIHRLPLPRPHLKVFEMLKVMNSN